MIIYDLISVCGSNLKPLHSGEKIAVWVQILSFRWRCYRQDLTPGYSFSLHCMGWEGWDPGGGLVGRLSATSSSRRQCDGGGGADLNTCNCRSHFPSVRDYNVIEKLWWYYGIINSTSLLDLAVVMSSQNKSSLRSIIAKGVKIGTDPLLPQNSH